VFLTRWNILGPLFQFSGDDGWEYYAEGSNREFTSQHGIESALRRRMWQRSIRQLDERASQTSGTAEAA